jgi:hypothetical protein
MSKLRARHGNDVSQLISTTPGDSEEGLIRYVNSCRPNNKPIRTIGPIFDLACSIAQAHEQLGKRRLRVFYRRIKLNPHDARTKKLRKIGAMRKAGPLCE